MAHLSERHEVAKRRRDEMNRSRSLALAMRTGYPPTFASPSTKRPATSAASTTVIPVMESKKYTAEDIAAAQLRCQERVRNTREQEKLSLRRQREIEQEQNKSDEGEAAKAAAIAAQRLRDRKEKDRRLEEEEIDLLISQQTSSIKAMNIARMLSPRFEERVEFERAISKHSTTEDRVVHLLTNARVGTFYQ